MLRYLVLALICASALNCGGAEGPKSCTKNEECFEGYACDVLVTKECLRSCSAQANCLDSQRCDIPSGETAGVCRFGVVGGD